MNDRPKRVGVLLCFVICLVFGVSANVETAYADACPSGGDHVFEGELVRPATETEEGLRTFTCLKCGYTFDKAFPPTGHAWGDWVTQVEPTCSTDGLAYRVCNNVASVTHYDEKVIPRLSATGEHSYALVREVAPTCTDGGVREYRCGLCGDVSYEDFEALGHMWTAWEAVQEATETAEGQSRRVCERDGAHVEYQSIPVAEKPREPQKEEPQPQQVAVVSQEEEPDDGFFSLSFTPNAVDAAFAIGDAIMIVIGLVLLIPLAVQVAWIRMRRRENLKTFVENTRKERREQQ